jgi:hypothetical protein
LTKKPGQWLPRALIFTAGIVWINVDRPNVDYKPYLGPAWKPAYEKTSTLVFNHVAWMVSYFKDEVILTILGYISWHVVGFT